MDDTTRVGGDGLQHLGPYRIDGPLGQGGMGEVFGATDMRLQRPVALKLIRGHGLADPAIRARFAREAQAASALNHPNICTVYDVGEANGVPYLVMELLEGETLGARLERGALPLHDVIGLTIEIADALDTAHAHQIVHRDIKPANIFITSRGRAKLMDFGVATRQRGDAGLSTTGLPATAALTELGQAIGTVAYMSPEQARGERLDARTDLFSLGVVMYESAAGTRPFHGGTDAVVFDALLNRDPVPLRTLREDVPEALDNIVSGLLQKDREARTPSAADLLRRLRSLGESTRPPALAEQSPARHSGRARALTAAAAVCLAIAAGSVAWWGRPTPPPREIRSVALLPFENKLGADASDVIDGLLAAVNGDLAKSQAIQVLAPGAVEQYRATTRTVSEIGRELDADALLSVVATGSGGRIQLNASLIEARNGRTFWSASFDRPRGQLDQLQADLADGVGHALGLTPAAPAGTRRTTTPAVDPRAYRPLLAGALSRQPVEREGHRPGHRAPRAGHDARRDLWCGAGTPRLRVRREIRKLPSD